MPIWDTAGYLASSLVITAFCMKDILQLRVAASVSNVAFLIYGLGLGLTPVWLLHAILLPVNLWRLWQCSSRDGVGAGRVQTKAPRTATKVRRSPTRPRSRATPFVSLITAYRTRKKCERGCNSIDTHSTSASKLFAPKVRFSV